MQAITNIIAQFHPTNYTTDRLRQIEIKEKLHPNLQSLSTNRAHQNVILAIEHADVRNRNQCMDHQTSVTVHQFRTIL